MAEATAGEDAAGRKTPWLRRLDSINQIREADHGCVILSGSHGGLYSAAKGLGAGPRGLVLSDAGRGRNGAGIAVIAAGDAVGAAVATIAHDSARIGDADDMGRRGVVSHASRAARAAGIVPGMACAAALERMAGLAPAAPIRIDVSETRHEIALSDASDPVICLDSASLIRPGDSGRVVVTGSHGGLIGGDPAKAINVAAAFAAFNDAGGGREGAGIGRLAPLEARRIPAVTVSADSAEIGNALSTLNDGVISHANPLARALGAVPGRPLRDFLAAWRAESA